MTELIQYLFDALSLGSLYALGALGIALIFGVMRLVNFAYGEAITFSVFALIMPTTEALTQLTLGLLPAPLLILAILIVGAVLSILMEILVFRRLRHASPMSMMVAAFALGFVIQNSLLMLYSSRAKSLDLWSSLNLPLNFLGVRVPVLQLLTVIIAVALLLTLVFMLKRTRVGLEMRAAAEDFTMARMLGVRANRVILSAFAISGMLAAVVGLLMLTKTGLADVRMGGPMMLVAFVATVIGGLGSLGGAVLAGFLLGVVNTFLQLILPLEARPFRDAFLYLAVIVLLLFRPAGLFVTSSSTQRV